MKLKELSNIKIKESVVCPNCKGLLTKKLDHSEMLISPLYKENNGQHSGVIFDFVCKTCETKIELSYSQTDDNKLIVIKRVTNVQKFEEDFFFINNVFEDDFVIMHKYQEKRGK